MSKGTNRDLLRVSISGDGVVVVDVYDGAYRAVAEVRLTDKDAEHVCTELFHAVARVRASRRAASTPARVLRLPTRQNEDEDKDDAS